MGSWVTGDAGGLVTVQEMTKLIMVTLKLSHLIQINLFPSKTSSNNKTLMDLWSQWQDSYYC